MSDRSLSLYSPKSREKYYLIQDLLEDNCIEKWLMPSYIYVAAIHETC